MVVHREFPIDEDFIPTLGMELAAGRNLSKEFPTDEAEGFIINEQAVAALIMILGYSIIVIPTGIIATTVPKTLPSQEDRVCAQCRNNLHDVDAVFCKRCGQKLDA